MRSADSLVGNKDNNNSKYCFAKPGAVYVVYLPGGGSAELDLGRDTASFQVQWFNPRKGGILQNGSISKIKGPGKASLGISPSGTEDDWIILVRKQAFSGMP